MTPTRIDTKKQEDLIQHGRDCGIIQWIIISAIVTDVFFISLFFYLVPTP